MNYVKAISNKQNWLFEMSSRNSGGAFCSRNYVQKSLKEVVAELVTPGKVMIQLNGWRNVCQTLEYIFDQWCDLFDDLSGISFEFQGLAQVIGNICAAEKLKSKVLLGGILKITTTSLKLDDERNVDLLEGFDDLDRNLKKLSSWGCNFVVLQVKLSCEKPYGARQIPFDNSECFGIFSATTQSLGMVPIIQFQYELLDSCEECSSAFVDSMHMVNQSLFDFDVDTNYLFISPLISYPLKSVKETATEKANILINSLKHSLPPAIGGVIFASEGSYKALGLQIDQISKIINRIPWPIICCYGWKISNVLGSDPVLEKWVKKQRVVIKMLSFASVGKLISWQGKLTIGIPDYISTHDYYDKEYAEAMQGSPD